MTPYDRWISGEEHDIAPLQEVEYICPKCGGSPTDHPEVPTPDGNNVMQVCPLKCAGCDQFIVITDGKSECGGEGEGICCVFADDEDPCPIHTVGHDPDDVLAARASHQAAFRAQEPWHLSDDCDEETNDDHTNPTYVLGAVLAQLEDLSIEDQLQVLHLALAAIETAEEVANEMPLTEDGRCPRCNSDLITFIDEHYSECCDCGWSGSTIPTTEGE